MDYSFEKQQLKRYLGSAYDMLKEYEVFIAGGAITSLFTNASINDIDIYFRNKESLKSFLYEHNFSAHMLAFTDKSLLFTYNNSLKLQCIHFKYFADAQEIFDTFDFTVCMGAFDFKDETFVLHKDFLRHNAQRILSFNSNTAFPIISALRVDKYKNKGFTISKAEFLKIMLTIAKCNFTSYQEVKVQLGGMYGENYDAILQPNPNEEFDITKIIDRISKIGQQYSDTDYKLSTCAYDIDDWKVFVESLLNGKVKYFEFKGSKFVVINGKISRYMGQVSDYFQKVELSDVIKFPMVMYKFVQKKDEQYYSYYNPSYEYRAGQIAVAEGSRGLFCVEAKNLARASYSGREDAVCIQVLVVSPDDIIGGLASQDLEVSKMLMVCEVDKEKVMKEGEQDGSYFL